MSVAFTRCRTTYTLRRGSPDVAGDDVKYDVSNYVRAAKTTTTPLWTSTRRPPCHHWPPCDRGFCLTSTAAVCTTPGHRLRRSDPHILLSPLAADRLGSGRLWDALESDDGRRCETGEGASSSPKRSRCPVHSSSSAEVTGAAAFPAND